MGGAGSAAGSSRRAPGECGVGVAGLAGGSALARAREAAGHLATLHSGTVAVQAWAVGGV